MKRSGIIIISGVLGTAAVIAAVQQHAENTKPTSAAAVEMRTVYNGMTRSQQRAWCEYVDDVGESTARSYWNDTHADVTSVEFGALVDLACS